MTHIDELACSLDTNPMEKVRGLATEAALKDMRESFYKPRDVRHMALKWVELSEGKLRHYDQHKDIAQLLEAGRRTALASGMLEAADQIEGKNNAN